jgi:hypothetical protein
LQPTPKGALVTAIRVEPSVIVERISQMNDITTSTNMQSLENPRVGDMWKEMSVVPYFLVVGVDGDQIKIISFIDTKDGVPNSKVIVDMYSWEIDYSKYAVVNKEWMRKIVKYSTIAIDGFVADVANTAKTQKLVQEFNDYQSKTTSIPYWLGMDSEPMTLDYLQLVQMFQTYIDIELIDMKTVHGSYYGTWIIPFGNSHYKLVAETVPDAKQGKERWAIYPTNKNFVLIKVQKKVTTTIEWV